MSVLVVRVKSCQTMPTSSGAHGDLRSRPPEMPPARQNARVCALQLPRSGPHHSAIRVFRWKSPAITRSCCGFHMAPRLSSVGRSTLFGFLGFSVWSPTRRRYTRASESSSRPKSCSHHALPHAASYLGSPEPVSRNEIVLYTKQKPKFQITQH